MYWFELPRKERHVLRSLFAGHRPSFLLDAVLEGHLGSATVDSPTEPRVAMLAYADVVIFGGDVGHPAARELAELLPEDRAVLPCPPLWMRLLASVHGDHLVPIERYAFTDESLDLAHLRALAAMLRPEFKIHRIDVETARAIAEDPSLLSPDQVRNFDSPEDFAERGIGFCVTKDGTIVAGASSYAICDAGIEIQVNTNLAYRGLGLATAVSARLIVHVLECGAAAHWDAANETSVRLAERLGYTPAGSYTAWVRIPEYA